jgi:hypothetical protein
MKSRKAPKRVFFGVVDEPLGLSCTCETRLLERAAVVAWLRERAAGFAAQAAQHFADGAIAVCTAASAIESQVTFAADAIERGEHVEGGGDE